MTEREEKIKNHREKRMGKKRKAKEVNGRDVKSKKLLFLEGYSKSGILSYAASFAGLKRTRQHYKWLDRDPEYAEAFELAKKEAGEHLEMEAFRRGVEGWEEPVFYKGEVVGHITRYSDQLLSLLLKGNVSEKYKDRVEHSGSMENTLSLKSLNLKNLSNEELKNLEELISKAEAIDVEPEAIEEADTVGEV